MISVLGMNIKKLREEKGLSAYKLAKLAKVGTATVYEIEDGTSQGMKDTTLKKIAEARELLSTYRSGSFLVNIPKRYKFTQANKVVPTSRKYQNYIANFSRFILAFISLSWFIPQLGQVQFLSARFFTSLFLYPHSEQS